LRENAVLHSPNLGLPELGCDLFNSLFFHIFSVKSFGESGEGGAKDKKLWGKQVD
jgi:hypothetical protein